MNQHSFVIIAVEGEVRDHAEAGMAMEIVQLITTGAPIPGIKDIPPTLLTDQATKPSKSKRRKPWEMDVPDEVIEGRVEGTFGDRRDEVIVQELPE